MRPAADLLLERQPARSRVLNPVDADALRPRSHTPVSVIGSASITKPGLTPVPSTATFAFRAALSIARGQRIVARTPDTPAPRSSRRSAPSSFRTSSICGRPSSATSWCTAPTTSGFAALIALRASAETLTRSFCRQAGHRRRDPGRPWRGSMSTAPTILNPCAWPPAAPRPRRSVRARNASRRIAIANHVAIIPIGALLVLRASVAIVTGPSRLVTTTFARASAWSMPRCAAPCRARGSSRRARNAVRVRARRSCSAAWPRRTPHRPSAAHRARRRATPTTPSTSTLDPARTHAHRPRVVTWRNLDVDAGVTSCSSTSIGTRGATRARPGCASAASPATRPSADADAADVGLGMDRRHRLRLSRRRQRRDGDLHGGAALHRAGRWERGRPDGAGRPAATRHGRAGRDHRRRDRLDGARAAHLRAHRRDRQLLSSWRSGFRSSACSRTAAGTATSSTPARSSSPTTASTTSG